MDYLYACLFSNGHIKVGRSSDPVTRIDQHADRVACLGVTLVQSHVAECRNNVEEREQLLIDNCCAAATTRHQREWFGGLEFSRVCAWANEAVDAAILPPVTLRFWPGVICDLQATGLTQAAIATHCECDQTTISALFTGRASEPLYSLGERLLSLRQQRRQPAA